MSKTVAVFGSLNVDVTFEVESFPKPGETLLCRAVTRGAGGKGLNQAVACAKAGAETALFGAVGMDDDGAFLLASLKEHGIAAAGVLSTADSCTGLAHIVVDRSGENSIVVASGANQSQSVGDALSAVADARVFLAQLEVDVPLVRQFLERGRQCGAVTLLNAAPAIDRARTLMPHCDVLIVNEHELAFYGGVEHIGTTDADIAAAARALMARSSQTVLVTLGAQGVVQVTLDSAVRHPATRVDPVDTTGAGDCFCGVLAASVAMGQPMAQAIRRATTAAAIAVTRKGAVAAMPYAAEIAR